MIPHTLLRDRFTRSTHALAHPSVGSPDDWAPGPGEPWPSLPLRMSLYRDCSSTSTHLDTPTKSVRYERTLELEVLRDNIFTHPYHAPTLVPRGCSGAQRVGGWCDVIPSFSLGQSQDMIGYLGGPVDEEDFAHHVGDVAKYFRVLRRASTPRKNFSRITFR